MVPSNDVDALSYKNHIDVTRMRELRRLIAHRYQPLLAAAPSPIRLMAQMVEEVVRKAHQQGISREIIAAEVVRRTVGDVDVRSISEIVDGIDYSTIGESLGVIMPGEIINGRTSDGATYLDLHDRMFRFERTLLTDYAVDIRMYDIYGVGNPLLRERLAGKFERDFGMEVAADHVYPTLGGMDGLDKVLRALNFYFRQKYGKRPAIAFPAPGFATILWQAQSYGIKVIRCLTREEDHFKLSADDLAVLLRKHDNLNFLYLTISNNPTAFAYSPEELSALMAVIGEVGREVAVLADLAYVGTGEPTEDYARMQAFNDPKTLQHMIFICSFSKIYTLTGERMGWAVVPNAEWRVHLPPAWNNTSAGLPGEWQLRFLAILEMLEERPWIRERINELYRLRRAALRQELEYINQRFELFENIGFDDDVTIYHWSKLRQGEDCVTMFEKTGIAGVPGSAFGYSDSYIRLSVGVTPAGRIINSGNTSSDGSLSVSLEPASSASGNQGILRWCVN